MLLESKGSSLTCFSTTQPVQWVAANWRRKLPFYIVEELILEADWVAEVGGQRRFTDFTAERWRMEEAWSGECGLVHGGA